MLLLDSGVFSLIKNNFRNKLAELFYFRLGIDITHPVQIYGIINTRCNAKCKTCPYWRTNDFSELPASSWIKGLRSLKSFIGPFHINFSGGEPLLKKDLFEILEYCKKANISAGITTNGILLNKTNIPMLISLKLFNINISIDSMDSKIHDELRGVPGLLSKVKENVNYLNEYKERVKSSIRIVLKPLVFNQNIYELDKIVEYSNKMNLTGVNFQPILKWTKESEELFKVENNALNDIINKLIVMKREGYNILNSETSIKQWALHFSKSMPKRNSPCVVALRNLTIDPNGDISLCGFRSSKIGNINSDDINEIWYSKETRRLRKSLVDCKRLCMATCVVKRTWRDYAQLMVKLYKT